MPNTNKLACPCGATFPPTAVWKSCCGGCWPGLATTPTLPWTTKMVVPVVGAWLLSSCEPIVLCRPDRDVCGRNSSTGRLLEMLPELGPTCIGCCSWNRLCCWFSVDVELLPDELWSWKDIGSAGSCWGIPTLMLPIGEGPWVWVLKRIVGGIACGLRSVVQRSRPVCWGWESWF